MTADIVVPDLPSRPEGGNRNAFRIDERVYQAYYAASNFSGLTSQTLITGIQFRIYPGTGGSSTTWPSQDLSFLSYFIQLSTASTELIAGGNFFTAFGSTAAFTDGQGDKITTVYNDALTITANTFTDLGGGVNPWDITIDFTTPYVMEVGETLVMTIRHSGYLPNDEEEVFFDTADYTDGIADAIVNTEDSDALNANTSSYPLIVNFIGISIPEPSTYATLLGGFAIVMAGLRRRRQVR